jgi:hypothetical protein
MAVASPLRTISNKPYCNEQCRRLAPQMAENGQFGMVTDGVTAAGVIPALILEKKDHEDDIVFAAD